MLERTTSSSSTTRTSHDRDCGSRLRFPAIAGVRPLSPREVALCAVRSPQDYPDAEGAMTCPHCRESMGALAHGFCSRCEKYCGCSFNPESLNDYCDTHRPAVAGVPHGGCMTGLPARELAPHPASCKHDDCQRLGECMHYAVCVTRQALAGQIENQRQTEEVFRKAAEVTQRDMAREVGGPCCAHLTLKYQTLEETPGFVVGAWWECKDCGAHFAITRIRDQSDLAALSTRSAEAPDA